jgi:hypothetical protein
LRRGLLSCQLTLMEAELVNAILLDEVQCGLEGVTMVSEVLALASEHTPWLAFLHSFAANQPIDLI